MKRPAFFPSSASSIMVVYPDRQITNFARFISATFSALLT